MDSSAIASRARHAAAAGAVLLIGALTAGGAVGATGSAAPVQDHVNARPNRPVVVSPRLGPPGTQVSLRVLSMPAMTPVQLALGATGTGFEALALGYTSMDGELQELVVVPEWSKPDETHRFIIFNLYFTAILAESAIFHVTDADGVVERVGTVAQSGPGCLFLEGDDDERYRLRGATDELTVGDAVSLAGRLVESTEGCGEDLSLDLEIRSIR